MIDYTPIRSGRVVVLPHWLDPPLVAAMRAEIGMLVASNQFYASGVAVGGADGEYGAEDRSVCVVSRQPGSARAVVDERIDRLCLDNTRMGAIWVKLYFLWVTWVSGFNNCPGIL